MLYWLHDELSDGVRTREPRTIEALRVLLRRSAEGKHLLLSGRPALTAIEEWGISQNAALDHRTRGALDGLRKHLKDAPGLSGACPWRIEVGPDRWVPAWNGTVWRQPVSRLQDMDTAAMSELVTEGDADGRLFEMAAKALHHHPTQPFPRLLMIALRHRLGAGSQIGIELLKATAEGAPALCWVDRDNAPPGGPSRA